MGYFLALDAGGTKTECLLADDNAVLVHASTGTVKLMRVSEAEATSRMTALLQEISQQADVPLTSITRTCMGLAGLSSPEVQQWARRTLEGLVSGEVLLCGDEEIALDAAFRGGPGILVIAGTGSNVVGRCADGRMFTAGGWGPAIGDEGSGYWIGREAIHMALRARDRGVNSCMLECIQKHWGMGSLGELVARANAQPAPDFAELVRVVSNCAETGDELARSLLERAGAELAEQILLVQVKMMAAKCEVPEHIAIAFTGSVVAHLTRVREAMICGLKSVLPEAAVLPEAVNSLEGALWRARQG